MSDKQMYDILGKLNNLEPKLTKVTDKDINQSVQETVDPNSLKGQIQQLEEKYMGYKQSNDMDESALQAYLGKKKYGEQGMKALQKAGRDGASKETMAKIRAKHDKMDEGAKHASRPGTKQRPGSTTQAEKAVARKKELKADLEKRRAEKPTDTDKKITEGKMKDLSMDLKELSEAEFKKKYGITKAEMRKSLSEAREMKDKNEFDRLAKVGDYYHTAKGGKVTKTARGIKHEEGSKKQKDDDLDESIVQEKAKSKAQQKFMGMVYAAKKGETAASPAVAKAAKGMSKSDAKDFAKTKHKGLPQHVKESHDIRKHPIYTTQEAWDHYSRELAEQEMSAMETDMAMEEPLMDADHELDEIARLAGLAPLPKEINIDKDTMAGKGLQKPDPMVKLPPAPPEEKYNPVLEGDTCNMTAEGTMCPEHGLAECGMYAEGNEFSGALAAARASGAKEFEVDGKEYPVHEGESTMDEGNEFTKARLDAIKAGKDTFTVGGKTHHVTGDTSSEKQQVEESLSVNINATDEDVVALMQKLAGLPTVAVTAAPSSSCGCDGALEEERDIEWDNTPEEQTLPISASIPNGTDLHKSKVQDPQTANRAANPLAETEEKLWKSYERMLKAIKD